MVHIARDVMTNNVITIPAGQSLAAAQQLMVEKKIRHLPVLGSDNRIIGILSDRDFSHLPNIEQIKVEAYMSCPVSWMTQETPLQTAIQTMLDNKISSVVVADENNELIGIVTTDDLLKLLMKSLDSISEKRPLSTIFDIQGLDEIAYKISQTGI